MKKLWVMVCLFLLSGCLLEGAPPLDPNLKPYGAHWIKEGMTKESRREDSWACGAADTIYAADRVAFNDKDYERERKASDKNDSGAHSRLYAKWRSCMSAKGYVFLKDCDARCQYP